MNRKDYYFRELVTEAELDEGFEGAEEADRNFAIDSDFKQKANGSNIPFSTPDTGDFNALLGGITKGLNVTISGLGATVSAGSAYDCHGRRICLTAPLTVDLSTTGDTSIGFGGAASGIGSISTAPAAGQFRWILLQLFFNRALTDPREDGNLSTVYFDSAESFQFKVKASASSATPTPPGGDANCIILGLFKRNDTNTITVQDYSTRGDWLRTFSTYSTNPLPTAQAENGTTTDVNFIQGTARGAIIKLRNAINLSTVNYAGHISQSTPQDKHAAKNIDFNATTANWADGTTPGLPTNLGGGVDTNGVQGTINTIVSLLSNVTAGQGGTKKLGGAAISGSPVTIAAGTIRAQLQNLLDGLNNHIAGSYQHPAADITATGSAIRVSSSVQGQLSDLEAISERRRPGIVFGNGSDGNVTISGTTVLASDKNYIDLTITNSGILLTNGFVVRVDGTLTIQGGGKLMAGDVSLAASSNRWGQDAHSNGNPGIGTITKDTGTILGGASGGVAGFTPDVPIAGEDTHFSLGGFGGAGGTGGAAGGSPFAFIGASDVGNVNSAVPRLLAESYLTPGMVPTISGATGTPKVMTMQGIQGGSGGGGGATGSVLSGGGGGSGGGVVAVLARTLNTAAASSIYAPGYPGGPCAGGSGGATAGTGGGGGGGGVVLAWFANRLGTLLTSAAACPGGVPGSDGTGATTALAGTAGTVHEFQVTVF